MRFLFLALSLFLTVASFAGPAPVAAGVEPKTQWHTDINTALAASRRTNTPMLVYFFSTASFHCRFMQEVTFKQSDVASSMSNFTLVALRVDRNDALAKKLSVLRAPTTIFVGKDGQEIGRIDGYIPSGHFLAMLDAALRGQQLPSPLPNVSAVPGDIVFEEKSGQTEFVVGPTGKIPGIKQLAPYMHGEVKESHRSDPKFRLETGPTGGAFVLVFSEVSEFGRNSIDIIVDGRVAASRKLQATKKEDALMVELSPGEHLVQVRNTGEDWLRVSRFEFHGLNPAPSH